MSAKNLRGCPNCQRGVVQTENGGTKRHRFWHTYLSILFAYVVRISDPSHSRSGLWVTSSDLTSSVWMFAIATPTEQLPWTLQRLIPVTVSIKCIARNFDIDMISIYFDINGKVRSILWPLELNGASFGGKLFWVHFFQTSGYNKETWHSESESENWDQWPLLMSRLEFLLSGG